MAAEYSIELSVVGVTDELSSFPGRHPRPLAADRDETRALLFYDDYEPSY